MAVQELTCIPARFTAGDTVKVRIAWSGYPASTWNLAAAFSGPSTFQGTITKIGDDFLLTIPAVATSDKPLGRYAWALRVTEISSGESVTAATGVVALSPDPFSPQNPSAAASLVVILQETIEKLAGKTVLSASVNGKSYTITDIDRLYEMLRKAKADLQAEIDDAAGIAGRSRSSLIRIRA